MNTSAPAVFIAEDDESQARLFSIAASEAYSGIKTETFSGAEELLARLSDENQPLPKLIIMDSKLKAVSGIEASSRIKNSSRTSFIPVLIFSASEHPDFFRECYDSGANACIAKPADYEALKKLFYDTFRFWLGINRLPE